MSKVRQKTRKPKTARQTQQENLFEVLCDDGKTLWMGFDRETHLPRIYKYRHRMLDDLFEGKLTCTHEYGSGRVVCTPVRAAVLLQRLMIGLREELPGVYQRVKPMMDGLFKTKVA